MYALIVIKDAKNQNVCGVNKRTRNTMLGIKVFVRCVFFYK